MAFRKKKILRIGLWCLLGAMLLSGCTGKTGPATDRTDGNRTSIEATDGSNVTDESKTERPGTSDEGPKELPTVDIEKSTAGRKYLQGTTNKDATAYGRGEEMRFTVSLRADGKLASCAKFQYTLKADDGRNETGYQDGKNGVFTLTTKLDIPGFVNLKVVACDANGEVISDVEQFTGGAGADITNIQKAKKEPSDFDKFWKNQLSKLEGTAPDLTEIREVTSPYPAYTIYAVKIRFYENNRWGDYVSGYLSVPKDAQKNSLSMRVSYMGAGIFDIAKRCAPGFVTLTVSAHSLELGQDSHYYGGQMNGRLKNWMNGYNATRELVYFREMILRDIQAVRFMKQYFAADGPDARFAGLWQSEEGLELSGGSQGGFQAVAVAALEPAGIKQIVIRYPWLCDIGGCGSNGRIGSTYMPKYTSALEYYDTVNFGRRLTCTTIIEEEGLGDDVATTTGVTIFWNNLNPSLTRKITYIQNQSHSHIPSTRENFTIEGTVTKN